MNASQFDRMSRMFAERKLSRRHSLAAAGGLAALTFTGVSAQDATPEATPMLPETDSGVAFMFVQSLGAGSIAAATDGVDSLLLVADHVAGQTLFFSDRPERIVGMVPTAEFLGGGVDREGLGFTEADPPNAALVLPDGKMVIVELIDPTYDASTGQVQYQLRILEDVTQVDLQLQAEPLTADAVAGEFTAASLFIDDCPNGAIACWNVDGHVGNYPTDGSDVGFCWDSDDLCCLPCSIPGNAQGNWDNVCNMTFSSDCQGGCSHSFTAAFSCAD